MDWQGSGLQTFLKGTIFPTPQPGLSTGPRHFFHFPFRQGILTGTPHGTTQPGHISPVFPKDFGPHFGFFGLTTQEPFPWNIFQIPQFFLDLGWHLGHFNPQNLKTFPKFGKPFSKPKVFFIGPRPKTPLGIFTPPKTNTVTLFRNLPPNRLEHLFGHGHRTVSHAWLHNNGHTFGLGHALDLFPWAVNPLFPPLFWTLNPFYGTLDLFFPTTSPFFLGFSTRVFYTFPPEHLFPTTFNPKKPGKTPTTF